MCVFIDPFEIQIHEFKGKTNRLPRPFKDPVSCTIYNHSNESIFKRRIPPSWIDSVYRIATRIQILVQRLRVGRLSCLRISGEEPSGEGVVVTRPIVSRAVAVLSAPRPHLLTAADMGHRQEESRDVGHQPARIEQTSELWNLERWLTTIVLRRLRLTLRLPSPLLGSSLIEEKYCLRSGIDDKRRIVWMS